MKKDGKLKRGAVKFGKRFINPNWTNKDTLFDCASAIKQAALRMFTIQKTESSESFEKVRTRLQLTDGMLKKKAKALKRLSLFFGLCSFLLFIYCLYNVINGYFLASILSGGLCCAMLGFTFKYHFWFFQISEQKLGCDLDEWWKYGVLRMKRKSEKVSHKKLQQK